MDFLKSRLVGPRNGRARAVLNLVDRGADSPIETLARELMRRAGLHVEAQALGFGALRFGYNDVVHHPERFLDRVTEVVARRLSLGGLPVY